MTISKKKELLYLTREDVISVGITKQEIIDCTENALRYHAKKEVEMPPKIGIHPLNDNTFIHAMPSYIRPEAACGIKWVSGYPDNPSKHKLPHIAGLVILNDDQTGYPLAIMDGSWITTMRTVAATMIGMNYLSAPESSTVGMIGCGDIGRHHIDFLVEVSPSIKTIYIYDKYEAVMDRIVDKYSAEKTTKIVKTTSIEELVRLSDTVISATIFSKPNPQIKDEWITKGKTILLCDSHTLYEDQTIKRADKYVIDSQEQGLHFETLGYYPDGLPLINCELGEIALGTKKGREYAEQIIINNNIGMSIEDILLAKKIYEIALNKKIGTSLSF